MVDSYTPGHFFQGMWEGCFGSTLSLAHLSEVYDLLHNYYPNLAQEDLGKIFGQIISHYMITNQTYLPPTDYLSATRNYLENIFASDLPLDQFPPLHFDTNSLRFLFSDTTPTAPIDLNIISLTLPTKVLLAAHNYLTINPEELALC